MTDIDLSNLPTPKLNELAKNIDKELKQRKIEERKYAKARIRELAASIGMTPEEILGIESAKTTLEEPKFRNPDNPDQTWTGRGKRPNWVNETLARGRSLEELRTR